MPALVKTLSRLKARVQNLHHLQTAAPNVRDLEDCAVVASVPQTEVWIAVESGRGSHGWSVSQAKISCYETEVRDYPAERGSMRGGDASRLARRWGRELPPGHPAYAEVHALAAVLGTSPRKSFVVIALDDSAPHEGALHPTEFTSSPEEDAIVEAIAHLVPLLGISGMTRVRDMVSA